MTPLGCRGAQERSRRGLWRKLAGTGKASKIYKFIHQKESLFMSSMCGFARAEEMDVRRKTGMRRKAEMGRSDSGLARGVKCTKSSAVKPP